MTDVEYILDANHRRARERELGERWDKIIRHRRRKSELLKASEAFCFSVGCVLLGGTAVLLGFGLFKAAFTLGGAAACFFVGAMLTGA